MYSHLKFEVGQSLYWTRGRDTPKEVTITKVGRVYLSLNNDQRVLRTTLLEPQSYGYLAKCWLSKELYEEHLKKCSAWCDLRDLISNIYSPPEHLAMDQILAIIKEISPQKPKEGDVQS